MEHFRDIYPIIAEYVSREGQPALRRVNKAFSKFPIQNTISYSLPSSVEIANWLWDQSQLLSFEQTHSAGLFSPIPNKFTEDDGTYITFAFVEDDGVKYLGPSRIIFLNIKTGELRKKIDAEDDDLPPFYSPVVKSRQKLYSFLKGYRLMYDYILEQTLHIVRDIFSLRGSIVNSNISTDRCFLWFLAKCFLNDLTVGKWPLILQRFTPLLTDEAGENMYLDFEGRVGVKIDREGWWVRMTDLLHDQKWFGEWFLWYACNVLESKDLRKSESISYLATHYR